MSDEKGTLKFIREAYARAAAEQPASYKPLPAWEELPLNMREAFVNVFHAGCSLAMDEAFKRYEM